MKTVVKRAYRKPEIIQVKLSPEEAVLSFCKTSILNTACTVGEPGSEVASLEFGS